MALTLIGLGNGLASGDKPLPEQIMSKYHDALWPH